MAISNFPQGFTNGLTVRDLPINIAYPGKLWWVNNSSVVAPGGIAGSDNARGYFTEPLKTIAGALAMVTPNRGDILMLAPGHAETISSATALSLNQAGVLIVGSGTGSLRPTITLDTGTTSTINVTANNCGFINCIFKANYAAISSLFTLTTATDFVLSSCEFRDTSSVLNFVNIVATDSTSNHADGLWIENCKMYGLGTTSNTCMVNATGTNDRWTLKNNYIAHAAVTGGGFMQTASGKNLTNLVCSGNSADLVGASTLTTGTFIIAGGTSNTGVISGNYCKSLDDTSPILVTASSGWVFSQNYYQANADKSGFLLPAVDS